MPGYTHKQIVVLQTAKENTIPSAVPSPETYTVAVTAGLAGVCETGDGTITFWAENVPEGDIQMQVSLLGQIADSSTETNDTSTLGDTTLGDMTL